MRILITGATGFVGRWLIPELETHGHETVAAPPSRSLAITDSDGVAELVAGTRPDAIVHLAGMAYAGDASRDPEAALRVNADGTRAVIEAAGRTAPRAAVLVTGSADVYGTPRPDDLPLRESAPLLAAEPYGRSKLAQERVAMDRSADLGVPLVATRSFNHTGPGQRRAFVAPALTGRLLEAKRTGSSTVPVGNLDVRRDIGDVRDVVRAYRLLLEGLIGGSIESGTAVNVATGTSIAIRDLYGLIANIVGSDARPQVEAALVRPDDPPLIVGDASKLREITGWEPRIPIETTVADLVASMADRAG